MRVMPERLLVVIVVVTAVILLLGPPLGLAFAGTRTTETGEFRDAVSIPCEGGKESVFTREFRSEPASKPAFACQSRPAPAASWSSLSI